MDIIKTKSHSTLINLALLLSIITIVYNIGEGIVSTLYGYSDETISLFGFGMDSFVEVLSGAGITMALQHKPETTIIGIIISIISILTMWLLMTAKLVVGKKLNSAAIIADAHCTKTCFYLSFILLAASLIYEFFKIPFIDAIGGLGIAFFAFREGKEAIEKSKSDKSCCCGVSDE